MIQEISETEKYLSSFERRAAKLNEPVWLGGLRQGAMDRFMELGFPTLKDEEWKYTDIRPIAEMPFVPGGYDPTGLDEGTIQTLTFDDSGCHRLVFINGHFSHELSAIWVLPAGMRVDALSEALDAAPDLVETHLGQYVSHTNQAFAALNTALFDDGAFIYIPRNVILQAPIHLVYISRAGDEPAASFPRTIIVTEENSQATIVETYASFGDGHTFSNAVTEIALGENAVLDHYKVERENTYAFHVTVTHVQQERSSNFTTHNLTLGGAIVRNDISAYLGGEGIESTLNGLYLAGGTQLIDNHSRIDHAMPHCNSHELYKGIMDDRSRGVFNGKIHVHLDAQKTDAKQTNQNILLSREATVNTKPQLEIYADDVRCTHGATIGQLSEDALFYLRARGIGLEDARSLLTYAFASDIISRVKVEPLRDRLEHVLFEVLNRPYDLDEVEPPE
jgi:Fe-S cluster assembly protein SufD